MIDLKPLADLSIVGIACVLAIIGLVVASVFIHVPMWWVVPASVVTWGALKLSVFRD